ncbi:hypothetical protein GLOIN_2v1692521 [Rhizophagus irregularis DAOM 181602=DAOM 197198]|uniref:Uncharacterized protein n=1 Tax=Rhizophagus irregularis (strain DAOM 181602 / DAOM 197198 / MUCL 43194) TaxID=747089 RepID=A0A2P4PBS5_RHIID|nr:hypothetical protein GLOIN_2v1692521 [Rhizophagus irregularis DAOM 181602=DAOM 197198]POG62831.1 hypothetical protein GLOIN_2v1692521 [Rhizophagus irregularis DAOM 181602=DAOM 197198]GET50001.1 hypothetical protein GLOIN_2v1692521 [Rhizophagus irregularis DAOM 181602=DAOM 197198]|eukprot:XP_025169697.1 hypothetical protein GLOIN_2v1692521 [Rhizophagus irregularis DAOM 181602=DAOM 197198]
MLNVYSTNSLNIVFIMFFIQFLDLLLTDHVLSVTHVNVTLSPNWLNCTFIFHVLYTNIPLFRNFPFSTSSHPTRLIPWFLLVC